VLSCRLSITISSALLIPSSTLQRPITRTISLQTKQPLTSPLDSPLKLAKPREVYDRVPMASYIYPRFTAERHHTASQALESPSHQHWHCSRHTDSEDPHPPRRRRWAAGYIDSRSCPSYDYIDKRPKLSDDEDSSDIEYIQPQTDRGDDSIESRRHRGSGTSRSRARYERERSTPQQLVRTSERLSESKTEEQSGSDMDIDEPCNRSSRAHALQRPTSSDPDSGEGSDILTTTSRISGSDVVSIRSGRSSSSASGKSASEASYVKLRRRKGGSSDSESDGDGDYISLDEYIAGRSDCNSVRVLSEDGDGEGSDAVGSDVGVRSDAGEGSDVASVKDCGGYDSEEDCIEGRCDGYYGSYARR
jgi:hypothetical protein